MGRGYISGIFWGAIIGALGLVTLSQFSGTVGTPLPPLEVEEAEIMVDEQPAAQMGTEAPSGSAGQDAVPSVAEDEAVSETSAAPALDSPSDEAAPQAGDTASVPSAQATTDTPGGSQDQDALPNVGQGETNAKVASAPALDMPDSDQTPQTGESAAVPNAATSADAMSSSPQADEGVAEISTQTDTSLNKSAPASPAAAGSGSAPVVDFSTPQIVQPTVPEEEALEEEPAAVEVAEATETQVAEVEEQPEERTKPAQTDKDEEGSLFKPVTSLVERNGSDNSARLPTIGTQNVGEQEPALPELFANDDERALYAFAAEFENAERRPAMSIVLLPDGDSWSEPQALPFVVTYGVDASQDQAMQRMRAVRRLGSEVAMIAPLPKGAQPQDVEVTFETYFERVPQAAVVLDVPSGEFQATRNVSSQLAELLAASGHGLVTYNRGLNAALQTAERNGVPAALVFRVIDEGGRDRNAIKRFLDQAAFRAGQSNSVILIAHNRPETIAALTEWTLGNRSETVLLAPLSAVLKAQ